MTKQKFRDFEWQLRPTLIKGKDAEKLYRTIQEDEKQFPENAELGFLDYLQETQEIIGSNSPRNGQINRLVYDSGLRVAVPGDDVNGDILRLIEGRYYSDFNAFAIREKQPIKEENKNLWKKLIELAEEHKGSVVKYPFMIQGFYTVPDENKKDFGWTIVPAPDFEVIEDDILSGKYNQWKFDKVDEKGLPLGLDKEKGKMVFWTRENYDGLSRVYVGSSGSLGFRGDNVSDSNGSGRVVLVNRGEATAQKFAIKEINKQYQEQLNEIEQRKQRALAIMCGK